jgi:hypothetical protein
MDCNKYIVYFRRFRLEFRFGFVFVFGYIYI